MANKDMMQQVEVAERLGNMLGKGIAFLVNAGVEVGKHAREAFVSITEKSPETAQALISTYQSIEEARINAEVRVNEMATKIFDTTIKGVVSLAEKVVERTDVNALIQHGISHDKVLQEARMKEAEAEMVRAQGDADRAKAVLVRETAAAKVIEQEMQARLLEAQNEAKREARLQAHA
jgi:hypothetical protein